MPNRLLPINESFLRPVDSKAEPVPPTVAERSVLRPPVRSLPVGDTKLKSNVCGIADNRGGHVVHIAEARVPVDEHGIWQFAGQQIQSGLSTYNPVQTPASPISDSVLVNINNALHDLLSRINAIYGDLADLSSRIDSISQNTLTWNLD